MLSAGPPPLPQLRSGVDVVLATVPVEAAAGRTAELGVRERERWMAWTRPGAGETTSVRSRARQWLAGRVAAKDALLALAAPLSAKDRAEVELVADARGRPRVELRGVRVDDVFVSIAHNRDLAVALAGRGSGLQGLGVDIEPARHSASFERRALLPSERSALAGLADERRVLARSLCWCAKEAAVKAWGTGMAGVGGVRQVRIDPTPLPVDASQHQTRQGGWATVQVCAGGAEQRRATVLVTHWVAEPVDVALAVALETETAGVATRVGLD